MSDKSYLRFRPVRGLDEEIKAMQPADGYVYFATDTRKIYCSENNQLISMGGDTGIYFGIKEIEEDKSGNEPDPIVIFDVDEVENSPTLMVDDLILNIDGCFYRVTSVDGDEITTKRLTLQGSGGGGASSGGTYKLAIQDGKNKVYSSTADSMIVSFIANYSGTDDNRISQVSVSLKNAETPFYTKSVSLSFNKVQSIDLIEFKSMFSTSSTVLTLTVEDLYGLEREVDFTVQIVELELTATAPTLFYTSNREYTYVCSLSGGSSGVTDKKIIYKFYNENNLDNAVLTIENNLNLNDEGSIQKTFDLSNLTHGIYVLEVMAQAAITGTTTLLKSNTITHKLGFFDIEVGGNQPLLMVSIPEVTEQYSNIPVDFLLVSADGNTKYTLSIKLNEKEKVQLDIYSGTLSSYNLYFEETGVYTAVFTVVELGTSYTQEIVISSYTGDIPIIDPAKNELMLYLTPKGKSNSAVDKDVWDDYNGRYTSTLTGFHYGKANGWLTDEVGTDYLYLASGAKLEVDFRPFEKDPTVTSAGSRWGNGITIELDFELNGVLDYDSELIHCISKNKRTDEIQCGFSITGNKASFYSSTKNGGSAGALAVLNLVEGKRARLTFVIEPNNSMIAYPMCYTYLNGILSGAAKYSKESDTFQDTTENPAKIIVDSTDGQVKIYGIRVYSAALDDKNILNNYTATLPTLAERESKYKENNVFNAAGDISYALVSADSYDLQIPYMKITGGWATQADNKWVLRDQSTANVGLPTGKKDYRLIDVEVVYPKNSYFEKYNNYSFKNEFASGKTMSTAYGEKPSNGGAIMYCQGTSSMEYPVKNLRVRFKNQDDYFTVRPDISPVEIICMKADYMESSGSHNTGAGNFIDAVYANRGIKTPGQKHFNTEDNTIVTCIKGHPCLIFYSATGESGSYEYIGKYNLNLDKATPEPFGFMHDDNDTEFGYLPEGEEYYDIPYDEEGEYTGTSETDEVKKTVGPGELVNAIHCFEFLDNATNVCNFLSKDANTSYHDTWYEAYEKVGSGIVPGWTLGFESRYPEDRVGYHDADALYPLASWVNELYTLKSGGDEAQALARFKNEYQAYFNKEFLLDYYLITEALLMVDSRVKNMMVATWGKDKYSYYPLKEVNGSWVEDRDQEKIETNNYIFYPIFYDMDTMLGLDNIGVNKYNYYTEDWDASVYNGEDILFDFVRDALSSELAVEYANLENGIMNAADILPYFNNNQANMASEAYYNGDADYKYLTPAREGYQDLLNDKYIAPGDAPFLYAAQGDRALMREYFLNNRIRFLRGKYASKKFQSGDRIEFRLFYPTEKNSQNSADKEKILKSIEKVPASDVFKLTSLRTGYAGVVIGANAADAHVARFDSEQEVELSVPEVQNANGTESYMMGLSTLSDIGDLSDKYPQKFMISSSDVRLKKLTLGNPYRYYYNPNWASSGEGGGQSLEIGISSCTYLEEFNLQNCSTYNNSLNFSNCYAIKKILLTGSSVSTVSLPENGLLEELRLPPMKTLTINGHSSLTDTGFSMGTYEYSSSDYIDGTGKYINDFSSIQKLNIVDTPINTYDIVTQAEDLRSYRLIGIDWKLENGEDTSYCVRTSSELPKEFEANKYYYYEDGYKLYSGTSYPSSGSLYEKFTLVENGKVTAIPVLEYLPTKEYLDSASHAEALSGNIHIDVDAEISEYDIYQKYHNVYPNVTFTYGDKVKLTNAYTIKFFNVEKDSFTESIVPYYTVLSNGTQNLAFLTSAAGPVGSALSTPTKMSTNVNTFSFSGVWIDVDTGTEYPVEKFSSVIPTTNLRLVPKFTANTRYYTLTLNMDKNTVIKQYTDLEWNANVYAYMGDEAYLCTYVPKDSSSLDENVRYAFKGWQTRTSYNNNVENPDLIDLTTYQIAGDLELYAYFEEEDCTLFSTNEDYFDFTDTTLSSYWDIEDGQEVQKSIEKGNGWTLSPKSLFAEHLEGKITIPSSYQGKPVLAIKGFTNNTTISHVFFLANSECLAVLESAFNISNNTTDVPALQAFYTPESMKYVGTGAFYSQTRLKHFDFVDGITTIGSGAFRNAAQTNIDELMSVEASALPKNLIELGSYAFYRGGAGLTFSELPKRLKVINEWTFAYCDNIRFTDFGYSNLLNTIKNRAFVVAANNQNFTDVPIIIGPNIAKTVTGSGAQGIQSCAFCLDDGVTGKRSNYYGKDSINNVIVYVAQGAAKEVPWKEFNAEQSVNGVDFPGFSSKITECTIEWVPES